MRPCTNFLCDNRLYCKTRLGSKHEQEVKDCETRKAFNRLERAFKKEWGGISEEYLRENFRDDFAGKWLLEQERQK